MLLSFWIDNPQRDGTEYPSGEFRNLRKLLIRIDPEKNKIAILRWCLVCRGHHRLYAFYLFHKFFVLVFETDQRHFHSRLDTKFFDSGFWMKNFFAPLARRSRT